MKPKHKLKTLKSKKNAKNVDKYHVCVKSSVKIYIDDF